MIYYEDDFAKNTGIILEFIHNLFSNARITVQAHGFYYKDTNPKYQLDDMRELQRFQIYLQGYMSAANTSLKVKRRRRVIDEDTGRMRTELVEDDYRLEDLVLDPSEDYITPNLERYIAALKDSSRYDAHTGFLDHIPAKRFFKQLCLFRFLYKYYFPQCLSPLSVDKFYFAFKSAFCPNEKSNVEGLVDAAFQTASIYHLSLSKSDPLLKKLKSDSIHIDVLRKEREQLCKSYTEAEQTSATHADYYRQYAAMLFQRSEFAKKILECAATVYVLGYRKTYEQSTYFHDVLNYIRQPNRDLNAHGRTNFERIFAPVYFQFLPGRGAMLTDHYRDQSFFTIVSSILIKCSTQRSNWNRRRAGRFLRWAHGFQFGKMAEAFIDMLNGAFVHLVHTRTNQQHYMFRPNVFRTTPYAVLTHCFDHDSSYRQAFQVISELERTRDSSRAAASGISYQVTEKDRAINTGMQRLEQDVEDLVASIATKHKMYLREKVLRKMESRRQEVGKKKGLFRSKKPSEGATGGATAGAAAKFTHQDSVFEQDTVSKVGGVNLPGRQSSVIASQRGRPDMHPIDDEDLEFAENFTGKEDKDFVTAVNMIMENCGEYTKLIGLHKKLSRTYLAREVKATSHVTWTGTERRPCTKLWSHIERIIQILALTNMVTRNVQLANITRITNHYFFLITDRHLSLFKSKKKKIVCGMAQRFFTDLRKKDYKGAVAHLEKKWERYVKLYNLPKMNATEVLAYGRGELGEGALRSLTEADEPQ